MALRIALDYGIVHILIEFSVMTPPYLDQTTEILGYQLQKPNWNLYLESIL